MQPTIAPFASPSRHGSPHRSVAIAVLAAVLPCGTPFSAEPSETAVLSELRAEVEALRARLAALESRLAAVGEATGARDIPTEAVAAVAVEPPAATAPTVELLAGPGLFARDTASGGAFRIGGCIQ